MINWISVFTQLFDIYTYNTNIISKYILDLLLNYAFFFNEMV